MNKIVWLLLIICLFNNHFTSAQTKSSTINDLIKLNSYKNDNEAEAFIVYDIGEAKFVISDNGFEIYFKRKCRLKILSEAGLDYTEIGIPLYHNNTDIEKIEQFTATSYNLDKNQITTTKTERRDLFEEKINKNWIRKKIAISGAKVGSVIDYEYTVSSPFVFNFHDWEFQYEIPVIYSEFNAYMIPFYTYSYIIIGTNRLDDFRKNEDTGLSNRFRGIEYSNMIYKFVKKDIPAFKDDSFISSPSDYKIKLDFQLSNIYRPDGSVQNIISTWEDISKNMLKHQMFGKYIKSSQKQAAKIIDNLDISGLSDVEKVDKLTSYVKNNFNWDGRYSEYAQKSVKNFLSEKTGNVGNINLFLIALLNEAKIKTQPVILSTRDNGKVYSDYPFTHFFNYVITKATVDGKEVLIDATEKNSTFDQLPQRCINNKGLIIQKENVEWVILSSKKPSIEDHKYILKLNSNLDSINCNYIYTATSFDALFEKNKYNKDTLKYTNELSNSTFDNSTSILVNNKEDSKYFKLEMNGLIYCDKIENYISIKPFLNRCISENPFYRKKRDYPIDMIYSRKRNFTTIIMLPENTQVIDIPQNFSVNNDNYSISYQTNINNNQLMISGQYHLKRNNYPSTDYMELQKIMDRIIYAFNYPIQIKLSD